MHGEALLLKIKKLPKSAKPIQVGQYLVVADSETLGNQHVVQNAEGCEFFELDGVRYMKNSKPTTVQCLLDRGKHSDIVLDPGVWEFDSQLEQDHFLELSRKVKD